MVGFRGQALLLLLAGAVAAPAQADFKRDYADGLKALDDQDFKRAAVEMEQAVAANPKSVARMRIYGMRFEPYMPHFYLGEARYRDGDCAAALEAWEEAERQGIVTSQPQFDALEKGKADCLASSVDIGPMAATARQSLDELAQELANLQELRSNRLLAADWRSSPGWETALTEGETARARLTEDLSQAEESRNATVIEQVTQNAADRRRQLQSLTATIKARVDNLQKRQSAQLAQDRDEARLELIQATASARAALGEPVADSGVQRLGKELLALAEQGDDIDPAAVAQTRGLTRSINGKLREYREALQEYRNTQRDLARRTPPDALLAAAEAYFTGRYAEVPKLLTNPGRFSDPRAQVQAHLFRAAAAYNLYVLAGETDRQILQQAAKDIRSIKLLTGGYAPYLAAFPPKFMSFYEATL